jgi:DNA-binding transcriptional regulator YiaG
MLYSRKTLQGGNKMSFSETIKKIRLNAFMSQQDFAKVLGVAYSTVNRWENGKGYPTYKAMKAIDDYCREHGIDFDIKKIRED